MSVKGFQRELEKAQEEVKKREEEIKAVMRDYDNGEYGRGQWVKDAVKEFFRKEEVYKHNDTIIETSANDLLIALKNAQKEDEEIAYLEEKIKECNGELVLFQENKNGEFESYCFKKKDLTQFSSVDDSISPMNKVDLETGRKWTKSDNIFYDIRGVAYYNLKESVRGSSAKLDKGRQDVMRNKKVIFDKIYDGEYGYSYTILLLIGNLYHLPDQDVYVHQRLLEEAKAEDDELEVLEECEKTQYETTEESAKCSELRRIKAERENARIKAEQDEKREDVKSRVMKYFDSYMERKNNSPMFISNTVMKLPLFTVREWYEALMQEELNFDSMSLSMARVELIRKIAKECYGKEENLAIEGFNDLDLDLMLMSLECYRNLFQTWQSLKEITVVV